MRPATWSTACAKQRWCATNVDGDVRNVFSTDTPVALTGDFNASPWGAEPGHISPIDPLEEPTGRLGTGEALKDTWPLADTPQELANCPSWVDKGRPPMCGLTAGIRGEPKNDDVFVMLKPGSRFDYIFVRGLATGSLKQVRQQWTPFAAADPALPYLERTEALYAQWGHLSDHLPVAATLVLPPT